ncbi:hypothetical protein [Streptomyces sp. NPDC059597]|uniref:hypothetical protein n=1 Tax=Streptomyces sp. NPDC059597 TaxID=3346879 RepID=UPI003685C55C
MTTTDPRIRHLAETMHRIVQEKATGLPKWEELPLSFREQAVAEAKLWLRAAVEAGLTPPAERPTGKHDAVWLDDEGFLWGEYQTSPPTPLADAAILRLVSASDVCSSKRELEEQGVQFRLIGWSE